jgi:hypothetical protein
MRYHKFIRPGVLIACFVLLAITLVPALATDPPKITVAPLWRPGTQLTSIGTVPTAGGDDIRYADAQVYVTTSVQFWAVQLTCTVNKTVLESFAPNDDPGLNTGWQVVTWGADWGQEGVEFAQVPASFNATTGAMTLTATLLGGRYPIGNNGYNTTLLLATVRYRVKGVAGTSPFTCTASFLNRNGTVVLAPTITAPAPLNVITGYTIAGKVTYQARTAHAGIGVTCTFDPDGAGTPSPSTTTNATGMFTLSNLRNLGFYGCEFYGNIASPGAGPDLHLMASSGVDLSAQSSHTFLPVVLRAGNLDRTTVGSETDIDDSDLIRVTANWNMTSPLGDANGDGKTDKADLAIVGGNYFEGDGRDASHMLFGLARNFDGIFPNSRVWLGETWAGEVSQLITGNNRDFWPMLSPDGSKIAFVREVGGRYVLYTIPASGVGVPTRITPVGAWYEAFAPSWSPDGTRIAFVCSWYAPDNPANDRGWPHNQGDVCVIDANGRNYQLVTSGALNHTKIYPPAWLSNDELLFGGTPAHFNCPDRICYYSLASRFLEELSNVRPGGIADMPVVRFGTVFYRYDDGSDTFLMMAEYDGGLPTYPATTSPVHVEATYDSTDTPDCSGTLTRLSTTIDYYAVSATGRNIVFYQITGNQFFNAYFNWDGTVPCWFGPSLSWHYVNDNAGNPFWTGSFDDPTDLFALRNTVDWTP